MCWRYRFHHSKHVMEAGKGAATRQKRGAKKANARRKCLLPTLTMPSLNASRASLGKDAQSDDEIIRVASCVIRVLLCTHWLGKVRPGGVTFILSKVGTFIRDHHPIQTWISRRITFKFSKCMNCCIYAHRFQLLG